MIEEKSKRPKGTGCVYMRAGTSVWWIKYSRRGKAYSESSGTTDKKKALQKLRLRIAEISTGSFQGPQVERIRVSELAEDLLREYRINNRKSIADVEARWKLHLKPFFELYRAIEVNNPTLTRYIEARQKEGAANATVNRELAFMKRAFHLGRAGNKVNIVPTFPHLQENNVRTGFLEDGQFQKLVEGAELWFRTLVDCGRTYGWRVSELVNLHVKQVDLMNRSIRLELGTTKNREGRNVIMTESVRILLTECVSGKNENDFVFTRLDGKPVRDFRDAWYRASVRAGLGTMKCNGCGFDVPPESACEGCRTRQYLSYRGLIFHDLRRTAARNLRRAGVAEGVIQKIGGWKTRSVFERYAIVDQSDIAAAMQKLEVAEKNSYSSGYSETQTAPESSKGRLN